MIRPHLACAMLVGLAVPAWPCRVVGPCHRRILLFAGPRSSRASGSSARNVSASYATMTASRFLEPLELLPSPYSLQGCASLAEAPAKRVRCGLSNSFLLVDLCRAVQSNHSHTLAEMGPRDRREDSSPPRFSPYSMSLLLVLQRKRPGLLSASAELNADPFRLRPSGDSKRC